MGWYSSRSMPSLWSKLKERDAPLKQPHSYILVALVKIGEGISLLFKMFIELLHYYVMAQPQWAHYNTV
jgi:hypothetical protein